MHDNEINPEKYLQFYVNKMMIYLHMIALYIHTEIGIDSKKGKHTQIKIEFIRFLINYSHMCEIMIYMDKGEYMYMYM